MNKKVLERAISIMDKHFKVCTDLEEFDKRAKEFNTQFANYYIEVMKCGEKLDEAKEGEETDEEVEWLQEYSANMDMYANFNKSYTENLKKYGTIANDIQNAVKEFEFLRDRINFQKLENAHALKLLDTFEKSTLEKQNEYADYKKEFEMFENRLAELQKRLVDNLN